jgi:hypothetical protein
MPRELTRPYKFGGGALLASGILFVVLALLNFRAGPPPSQGAEILLWRDSQALVLDFVSEFLFFATVLLVTAKRRLNARRSAGSGSVKVSIKPDPLVLPHSACSRPVSSRSPGPAPPDSASAKLHLQHA